jgi:phage terminase Nu1 subunit (DNA packaging protein)
VSKQSKPAGAWIPEACSKADLAVVFGVSIRTVSELDQRGVLTRSDKRGQFVTRPSIDAYITTLRRTAAGRTEETKSKLTDERLATERVSRQIQEMKLAEMRGEILTLDEVSEAWVKVASFIKRSMLSVPSKARTVLPHLTAHDAETLKTLIKDVLNEAADEAADAASLGADAALLEER